MNHNVEFEQFKTKPLHLQSTIFRLVHVDGWNAKQAEQGKEEYLRYLFLRKKYSHENLLPPSRDIDEVWHAHILHTREYQQDCETIFGEYLQHNPANNLHGANSLHELEQGFAITQKLYQKEFGDYLYQFMPSLLTRVARIYGRKLVMTVTGFLRKSLLLLGLEKSY